MKGGDTSFYRFQTPYFWPSNCWEPENMDYGFFYFKMSANKCPQKLKKLADIFCGLSKFNFKKLFFNLNFYLKPFIYAKEQCKTKHI